MEVKPGYKQTEIGVIPEDWNLSVIQKACVIKGRVGWKGYKKEDLRRYGPLVIGAKHIDKRNRLDLSEPTFISYEKFIESPDIMIQLDDVLLVQRGSIGKVVHINRTLSAATINPSMIILRSTNVFPSFLYYFLNSAVGQMQITDDLSSTGVPMITQNQVSKFLIPIPSKREQESISSVLESIDSLIIYLEKLIEKKKLIKQGVMQELLTGRKRIPGFTKEWGYTTLGSYASKQKNAIVDGPFGSQMKVSELLKEGIALIEMEHLNNKEIVTDDLKRFISQSKFNDLIRSAVYPNDIIISKTGSLGYLGIVPNDLKKAMITSRLAKVSLDSTLTDARFIFACLQMLFEQSYWESVSQGGTMQILSIRNISEAPIPNISIEEQKAISDIFVVLDNEIQSLNTQLSKYRLLKQGMMLELLTGRIRLI